MICAYFLALRLGAQDASASLTGKVRDITGAGVSGVQALLQPEIGTGVDFRTRADSYGLYHFSELPHGVFTLKLTEPGFKSLLVKSISILRGEQKSLPVLQLDVGDCGGNAVLDYIRILPAGNHTGDLAGSVRDDQGPPTGTPVDGADVALICGASKICAATKTDANGKFAFRALPPGDASVRVERSGFYPFIRPGFVIKEGIESDYWSINVERCFRGNCDPNLRPKQPIAICE